ncbi:amidohydrolase family protein [uncultured Robinsoniella sp.]|uniref:amidohydrolase family protein n=1 Tax=uncultured Robinsoniella sp. TaxID=904190 RepID=UPI00374F9395
MNMNKNCYAVKGNIIYSTSLDQLVIIENGYVVCENGISQGAYENLPERFRGIQVKDYGDRLVIPGLVDLHMHAPQYGLRGFGMDLELLDWLNTYTFPEEARYADKEYAKKAYGMFTEELQKSPTTRACIFSTIHRDATRILMDLLEKTKLRTMVGKVNMDRNAPEYLCETSEESREETLRWLKEMEGRYEYTTPILTPRFIPSCSDSLMRRLGEIQKSHHLPVQSHLSENEGEIAWVKELCPSAGFYGEAYEQAGLFGDGYKTVMAHCVSSEEEEIALIRKNGVYVAHCPQSNMNLSSGIAPVRKYLDEGLHVGLGSDLAGGSSMSMFRAMSDAIQVSKLYWRLVDQSASPLTLREVFYLATKGGGGFFGKVGSFEAGFAFDALVIDDESIWHPQTLGLSQRLERVIYLGDSSHIFEKIVEGEIL